MPLGEDRRLEALVRLTELRPDLDGARAQQARMLLDASKQVEGEAGDYQVDGANRVATLNIGGSTTTTACFVVEGSSES